MSKVGLVKCEEYAKVKEAIKRSLDLVGGLRKFVKKGDRVLLKPNISDPLPPEKAAVTHPLFVRAVIELVKEITSDICVGEQAASSMHGTTNEAYHKSGLAEVVKETGTVFKNFQEGVFVVKKIPDYVVLQKTDLVKAMFEADVIINLPKLKSHSITYLTGAVKNFFGCLHSDERMFLHKEFRGDSKFSQAIVDVFSIMKPKLTIMDVIVAMEGDEGPAYGSPIGIGYVITSSDAVAVDAVAAKITGHHPLGILTTRFAHERGLGVGDISKIQLVGDRLISKGFQQHSSYTNHGQLMQPEITDKCTLCGACYANCPVDAIEKVKGKYLINAEKCIQCMCCLEVCCHEAIKAVPIKIPRLKTGSTCNNNCIFCNGFRVKAEYDKSLDEIKNELCELRKKSSMITLPCNSDSRKDFKEILSAVRIAW